MGSRPVQHPRELKTYVKKAICDGKRFTTFSRLLVPAEADKTVKGLVCTLSRRDGSDMCKISFFYVGLLTFYSAAV